MNLSELPPAECRLGYTDAQVRAIVKDVDDFEEKSRGSTQAVCVGKKCDKAHGVVVYGADLRKYLILAERR